MSDPIPLREVLMQYVDQLAHDVETATFNSMLAADPAGVLLVQHHHAVASHAVYITPGIPPGEVHIFHCGGDVCGNPDDVGG